MLFSADWDAPGGNLLWLGVFAVLLAFTGWLGWRLGEFSDPGRLADRSGRLIP
jgi:hypothetical protein